VNILRTTYLQTSRERLRENPVLLLVGPRQAGKTTLAWMLAEQSAEAVHFFDLESPGACPSST
jgi:predicted AAA+ superfamily ATPase